MKKQIFPKLGTAYAVAAFFGGAQAYLALDADNAAPIGYDQVIV